MVTYTCNLVIIGVANGLLPAQNQAIAWISADLLLLFINKL